jgi:hypothetical protein
VADAAPQDSTPIWVLPGVDLGSILSPTIQLPTQILAPVNGLLGLTSTSVAAKPSDVVIVDPPDTSGLNNIWTFAPLGVPILGLIQSVTQVPGRLLP